MMNLNMTESDTMNDDADYARAGDAAASAAVASPAAPARRRFAPRLVPTLAAAVLVPLFICAGQWQWNKAAAKADWQAQRAAQQAQPALPIPPTVADAQTFRHRTVVARGHYEAQRQILIDNRIYRGQAGYHVLTPLRVEGSDTRLLVNRGWIPAPAERSQLPQLTTPGASVEVRGTASVPSQRVFLLAAEPASTRTAWPSVWQNIDLAAYARAAGFTVQPIVIELDAQSAAGGFVREWQPADDRRARNLAYAFQWWGFAVTTAVLWLVVNYRRPS